MTHRREAHCRRHRPRRRRLEPMFPRAPAPRAPPGRRPRLQRRGRRPEDPRPLFADPASPHPRQRPRRGRPSRPSSACRPPPTAARFNGSSTRSLREIRPRVRVFAPYRGVRKVSIFGCARTGEDHPAYVAAATFGRDGGAGLDGHHRRRPRHHGGRPRGRRQGDVVRPRHPPSLRAARQRPIADDPKLINFKYFFTRKLMFLKDPTPSPAPRRLWHAGRGVRGSDARADRQERHPPNHPPRAAGHHLLDSRLAHSSSPSTSLEPRPHLAPRPLVLLKLAASPAEAVAEIPETFYRNYHSARFVGERLILRLHHTRDVFTPSCASTATSPTSPSAAPSKSSSPRPRRRRTTTPSR